MQNEVTYFHSPQIQLFIHFVLLNFLVLFKQCDYLLYKYYTVQRGYNILCREVIKYINLQLLQRRILIIFLLKTVKS